LAAEGAPRPPVLLTPVANEKIFNQKKFRNFLFFVHLCVVELAYRQIFFFRFILSCQQFDNCSHCLPPVSCGKFATGVDDTFGNLPPVSTTLAKLVENFAAGVVDTGDAP
jgi:hypothetical protein